VKTSGFGLQASGKDGLGPAADAAESPKPKA